MHWPSVISTRAEAEGINHSQPNAWLITEKQTVQFLHLQWSLSLLIWQQAFALRSKVISRAEQMSVYHRRQMHQTQGAWMPWIWSLLLCWNAIPPPLKAGNRLDPSSRMKEKRTLSPQNTDWQDWREISERDLISWPFFVISCTCGSCHKTSLWAEC